MRVKALTLLSVVLAICLVAALLFTGGAITGGGDEVADYTAKGIEYEPFYDLDDDGYIDTLDMSIVIDHFLTEGEEFITKAGLTYDSGWVDSTDKCGQYFNVTHNLNSTDVIVDITGKTTVDGGVHQRNLGLTGYTGWSRTYGGTDNDVLRCIIQTTDGGYALAGYTKSSGAGGLDMWLVKTDWAGNMEWNRTYGGTEEDYAVSVVQTGDGGYAIGGTTWSFGPGQDDFWLVKTDASGNHEWNKTYGGTDRDFADSMVQTSDGGYALAGLTWSYDVGDGDFWLVKTNATGDMEWSKNYDKATKGERAYSVVQTSDGGYALAGSVWSFATDSDFWLVKTDSSGNKEWDKTYAGTGTAPVCDCARSVVQTSDGGYALAGFCDKWGVYDLWLIKTDSSGNKQWDKTYGGANGDAASCVIQTCDGGYAIAGGTSSFGAGDGDAWLIKTDASGNHLWNRTYGGTKGDSAGSVVETGDGGYAIAGYTASFGAGGIDGWLIKTSVESGLAWTDSTADTITLYRGATDPHWNYVRVRIWKIKETP